MPKSINIEVLNMATELPRVREGITLMMYCFTQIEVCSSSTIEYKGTQR